MRIMARGEVSIHDYGLGLVDGDPVGGGPVLEVAKGVLEGDVFGSAFVNADTPGRVVAVQYFHRAGVPIRASLINIKKHKGHIFVWDATGEGPEVGNWPLGGAQPGDTHRGSLHTMK